MCVSSSSLSTKANPLQVDMDKLADGLQKLNEDDLLQVVQMVHDNKSADSYTVNDVERKSPLRPPSYF
jgi:transcription initiation factor IIF auxiliary subunit